MITLPFLCSSSCNLQSPVLILKSPGGGGGGGGGGAVGIHRSLLCEKHSFFKKKMININTVP